MGDIEALFTVPYNAISNNLESLKNNGQLTIQLNQSTVQLPVIDTAPFKYNKENIVFLDLTAFFDLFPNYSGLSEVDLSIPNDGIDDLNAQLSAINNDLYALDPSSHAKDAKKLTDSFSINLIFYQASQF